MVHVQGVGLDKVDAADRAFFQRALKDPALRDVRSGDCRGRSVIGVCKTPPALIRRLVEEHLRFRLTS